MATRPQAAIEAGDTLDNLVNQFTDPYACLRELVQNSTDAGSTSVNVDFEFRPYEGGGRGIAIIHVDDTGEGMTRVVVDTKLTQLFSSSKEDDLTKIGKFGIGFVSVFALEPKAVIVDTGRDGEYWRIFFKEDRTFDRIVLDHPVEGTQIQIIKEVTATEFEEMRRRGRDTIVYWCKHTEAEIYIDGDLINQDFSLDSPYGFFREVPGTQIVLAPSSDPQPYFGFYNRGLTLKEGKHQYVPGVRFKIKSRYLEHTLTRDNVLEDENYDKAMEILREAVDGPFREGLFKAAARGEDDAVYGFLVDRLERLPRHLRSVPIVHAHDGPPLSLDDLRHFARRHDEIFWEPQATHVTAALRQRDIPVLRWKGPSEEPGLARLLQAVCAKVSLKRSMEAWALPTVVDNLPGTAHKLLQSSARILGRAGSPYKDLVPASFDYPGSNIADDLYLEQDKAGDLVRRDGKGGRGHWMDILLGKVRGKVLLLNVAHPLIEPHFRLVDSHPALAAYLLAKAVTLDDGLAPETEARLVEAALDEERVSA